MGICYGLQLIAKLFGGKIKSSKAEESLVEPSNKKNYFTNKKFFNKKTTVWMSHEDAVVKLPKTFQTVCFYKKFKINNNRKYQKKIYGVQFHPEVTHTENGKQIFKNFIF